jgi:hypothetical protein
MYKRQDLIGQDIGKLMEGNHATWHSSYVKQVRRPINFRIFCARYLCLR